MKAFKLLKTIVTVTIVYPVMAGMYLMLAAMAGLAIAIFLVAIALALAYFSSKEFFHYEWFKFERR